MAEGRPSDEGRDGLTSRHRLSITGTVQGVGFRPFVWRLAARYGLTGFVRNGGSGVIIEAQGPNAALEAFAQACRNETPPLAVIDTFASEALVPVASERTFRVDESCKDGSGAQVPPDVGPCPACIAEVLDPNNRRYLYPFITCTDCGPRLTIVEKLPYDRSRTTMAAFALCPECAAEYHDPASRRFHAEAIACPKCGPQLSHSIAAMVDALASGGIVALKGLGGFHLACDAGNEAAVARLRRRKGRDAKPFAVMVADIASAQHYGRIREIEETLLGSRERPIVIVAAAGAALAPSVSSGLPTVGLMLPSSMLHELLLREAAHRGLTALVMTSGNISGEPVLTDNDEARQNLADVADLIVTHNRPIAARADDTVAMDVAGAPAFVRRSRGTVPIAIDLASDGPDVLALGGDLKVTACVLKGTRAHLSAHVGDLETPTAIEALEDAAERLLHLTGAVPRAIAHDLHPDFASTLLAKRLAVRFGCPAIAVQHHHAHAAAVAAEHRCETAIAITLDGFGLGPASAAVRAWGGEVLLHRGATFDHLGTMMPLLEPGGDLAAREPWRMATGILSRLGLDAAKRFADQPQAGRLAHLLTQGAITQQTSSVGRLFDAASALLGICTVNRFEAEAAMRLQTLASTAQALPGGYVLRPGTPMTIDFTPLLERSAAGCDPAQGAAWLHGTVAAGYAELVARTAPAGLPVVLSGGCFLNRVLAEAMRDMLTAQGFCVHVARQAPCNDGGLSLGQAVIARAQLIAGS